MGFIDTVKGAADPLGLFSGEDVQAYNPDEGSFQYGGSENGGVNRRAQHDGRAEDARGRTGPEIDYGNADQSRGLGLDSRGQMGQHIGQMQAFAKDASGSVAAQQLRQATDAGIRDAMAMARSGRGGNPAMAQRAGLQAGAGMSQTAAGQAATLRASEQQWAQGQIGQLLAQQRAQDLQLQGLDASQAQAQAELEMSQRQLNDSTALGYSGLGDAAVESQLAASMAYEKQKGDAAMAAAQANAAADAQRDGAMIGAAGTVISGGLF